ncbi:MAG TPA: choice-of-anchor Q domain-containing protein, partial [Candidatus Methylomirabilis sp.]|nr:choice-of-anchor Q domain-containing protein [Candidatus Methylomirabilis sp.]
GEIFPLTISTDLTLTGSGAGGTILDATGANQRVITISSGTVSIAEVTIMGGAVRCSLFSCGAHGGGLSNESSEGNLTVTASTVTGNTASCTGSSCGAHGGGLFNFGTLTLTNSTVSGNTASCTDNGSGCEAGGGGFDNAFSGTMTVTASTVTGNTVSCTASGNGTCDEAAHGGGLTNAFGGTMTLTNSTVTGNMVSCTDSGCDVFSGGLINFGTLTLTNSTLSGNTASCTNSGSASCRAGGGGLDNAGTLTLTNSTVTGNTASCTTSGSGPCSALGGGLFNGFFGSALMTLTNATVTANSVTCSGAGCTSVGGGLDNAAGTTTLQNTVVAKQLPGADCANSATLTSNGFNLASDNTCQLSQPSDKPNVTNPLLGPLQNNGGPTQTHALLPGSPAIDAVTSGCPPPATDQRGVVRPQGAACDIGAFEARLPIDLTVFLNQGVFGPGNTLTLGVGALNYGPDRLTDFFLAGIFPDGVTAAFVTNLSPPTFALTRLDADPRTFPPLISNILVPQAFVFRDNMLSFIIPGEGIPLGAYQFCAALTAPLAFADGVFDIQRLLALACTGFSVGP